MRCRCWRMRWQRRSPPRWTSAAASARLDIEARPGGVADVGLRVDIEGLAGTREATYAFEVRATQGYDYEVRREQCLCVAEDGPRSWFQRDGRDFVGNIRTQPALSPRALALPLVAGDQRFAPVEQFLSNIQPYRIDPRTLREMQDPDAGVRLRSDGANAASVLRQLDSDTRQHLQEFLQTVVPGEVEVKPKRVENKLSLEFEQQGEGAALRLGPHNMSDGTLRTLGLLATVFQPELPSVLIVEEPEATIHPGALGTILDVLRHALVRRRRSSPRTAQTSSTRDGSKTATCAL